MKRPRSSHKKRGQLGPSIRRAFVFGALAIVGLFGILSLFGENGVIDMIRLKTMQHQIEAENQRLMDKQQALLDERARLQDPHYVEFLAREQLGMLKPNEVFIILDESPD